MSEFILQVLRVLAELLFEQTGKLVLRALSFGRIVIAPALSLIPLRRMPDGTIGVQAYVALILGMMVWALAAIVLVARFRG